MSKLSKIYRPVRFNSDTFERNERENAKRQRRLDRIMRRSEKEIYLVKENNFLKSN